MTSHTQFKVQDLLSSKIYSILLSQINPIFDAGLKLVYIIARSPRWHHPNPPGLFSFSSNGSTLKHTGWPPVSSHPRIGNADYFPSSVLSQTSRSWKLRNYTLP